MTEKKWRSKVVAHLIMKNEEKVLKRCLDSMQGVYDTCILVDTGSTDKSIEIAKQYDNVILEHFEWVMDFGKARNYALDKALEHCPDADWLIWWDIDDVLMSPEDPIKFREVLDRYLDDPNVVGINSPYIYSHEKNEIGNQGIANFKYHRLRAFKRGKGKWKARIHEYIESSEPHKHVCSNEVVWHHFRDEHLGTLNTKRNLEILRLVVDECTPEERPRTLFYYGKECTYNGLWDEAIKAFEEYIPMSNWLPEKHRAMFELAECYRRRKEYDKAREYAFKAINLDKRYADPWLYLAKDAYEAQDWKMAVAYAMMIPQLDNPQTLFFDYIPASTYLPYDYAQASYYYLNDLPKAKECLLKCMSYRPHERRYLRNYSLFFKQDADKEKIAIVIPTLNRKDRLLNCLEKIKENAYIPYEVFIGVDGNIEYFNELNELLKDETNVTTILFEEKSTVPIIVEELIDVAEKSGCKYVTYLGDDTEPLVGFLIHAYEACEGKYLVSYNDKVWKGEIACHWFAPIKLRQEFGGYFFYRGYNHVGCDNELTAKAKFRGLYKFCENAFVDHVHYIKNICSEKDKVAEYDECYKLAWGDENQTNRDRDLLKRRIKNNFIADTDVVKINIGCGYKNPDGYITLDKFQPADIKADIFDQNLFYNETVDKFLCEHVLEHFTQQDGNKFMNICYKALKNDGELEVAVPDIENVHTVDDVEYRIKVMYGWQMDGMRHKWGFSETSLRKLFEQHNFVVKSLEKTFEYDAPALRIIGVKSVVK